MRAGKGGFVFGKLKLALKKISAGRRPVRAIRPMPFSSGCAVGLPFLSVGEPTAWKLPFTLAIAVLLASYVVRIPVMWRQAPITAAVVIAGSLSTHSKMVGAETGLRRVSEVIFGCVVALAVSLLMAKIWPLPDSGPAPKPANPP